MKKIILLITILSIFIGLKLDVYAATYSDEFYISSEIEGISYAKVKNGKTEYRKAKFKRRSSDKKVVYCIEPFVDLAENTNYKGYDYNYEKLLNMSKATWKRISLLSYYGYGYKNHTAEKWYPITQMLIWQTIDKNATFYWTDSFKGNKVTKFTEEINEIEKLVSEHEKKPSFNGKKYDMSISSTLTLTDTNNVLSNYKIVNSDGIDVKISGNKLVINSKDISEEIKIKLVKKDSIYNALPVIYVSDTYQNVLSVGSYDEVNSDLDLTINSGEVRIVKLDNDTKDTKPQGEASLVGAIYELFNDKNECVGEITIGEDNTGSLKNLKYGKYKLKEKSSGKGYNLDQNEYEIEINKDNKLVELSLTNEVIKRKIKIYKYFENDEQNKKVEQNIKFQIFDKNNNLYTEVITDEYGIVEFELPYGTYTVKQVNTTDGYYMVDDFTIKVDEDAKELIEFYLNDLKIPNTYSYDNTYIILIMLISSIFVLRYVKKMC